jgi:hypothetical protein
MEARCRVCRALFVLTFAIALAVGCGGDSDGKTVRGSCSTATLSDGSVITFEYLNAGVAKDFKPLCTTIMRGDWSDGPGNTEGALGGCRVSDGKSIMWAFPSKKFGESVDIEQWCGEQEGRFLTASR